MELMYNTHNPLSPNMVSAPDLFYKEQMRIWQIHSDEDYGMEMWGYYHEWLCQHGPGKAIISPISPMWI